MINTGILKNYEWCLDYLYPHHLLLLHLPLLKRIEKDVIENKKPF